MIIKLGNIVGGGQSQGGSTYSPKGICPTLLQGMSHGNVMPFVIEVKRIDRTNQHGSRRNGSDD